MAMEGEWVARLMEGSVAEREGVWRVPGNGIRMGWEG